MAKRRDRAARIDGKHNGHAPPGKVARLLKRFAEAQRRVADLARQLEAAGLNPPGTNGDGLDALTPREREVAELFARAPCDKTIAAALGRSVWTVRTQLTRIRAKLGVQTREDLLLRLLHHTNNSA